MLFNILQKNLHNFKNYVDIYINMWYINICKRQRLFHAIAYIRIAERSTYGTTENN